MPKRQDNGARVQQGLGPAAPTSTSQAACATKAPVRPSLWHRTLAAMQQHVDLFLGMALLKLLLIPAYRSTDFEVHRNWMAVTSNTPLHMWYREATSMWTLDYPPFFAFFEWGLAQLARVFAPEALQLSPVEVVSDRIIVFQRLSVLLSEIVLFWGVCMLLATQQLDSGLKAPANTTAVQAKRWSSGALLVLCNAGLLLVDNIHFQYNGMLLGLLFISIALMREDRLIASIATYSCLVMFKHLFIFSAPAYAVYTLHLLISKRVTFSTVANSTGLAAAVMVAGLAPFWVLNPQPGTFLPALFQRLFPFERGLVHDYWAPNFWALYLTADKCLTALLSRLFSGSAWNRREVSDLCPTGVLPCPSAANCITLIILADCVIAWKVLRRSTPPNFILLLGTSYLSAFMFGWHTHEKAVLYALLPLLALPDEVPNLAGMLSIATLAGHVCILPLFFLPREQVSVLSAVVLYQCLLFLVLDGKAGNQLMWWSAFACPLLGVYYLHNVIVPSLPFLHLLLVSDGAAIVLLLAYFMCIREV